MSVSCCCLNDFPCKSCKGPFNCALAPHEDIYRPLDLVCLTWLFYALYFVTDADVETQQNKLYIVLWPFKIVLEAAVAVHFQTNKLNCISRTACGSGVLTDKCAHGRQACCCCCCSFYRRSGSILKWCFGTNLRPIQAWLNSILSCQHWPTCFVNAAKTVDIQAAQRGKDRLFYSFPCLFNVWNISSHPVYARYCRFEPCRIVPMANSQRYSLISSTHMGLGWNDSSVDFKIPQTLQTYQFLFSNKDVWEKKTKLMYE